MSFPKIPPKPSLPQLQEYTKAVCKAHGWDQATDLETFLLFSEEVGEMAKAIRHRRNLFLEEGKTRDPFELESEFADVLSYLLDLANRFEVDLEAAFRKKEAINATRSWD